MEIISKIFNVIGLSESLTGLAVCGWFLAFGGSDECALLDFPDCFSEINVLMWLSLIQIIRPTIIKHIIVVVIRPIIIQHINVMY